MRTCISINKINLCRMAAVFVCQRFKPEHAATSVDSWATARQCHVCRIRRRWFSVDTRRRSIRRSRRASASCCSCSAVCVTSARRRSSTSSSRRPSATFHLTGFLSTSTNLLISDEWWWSDNFFAPVWFERELNGKQEHSATRNHCKTVQTLVAMLHRHIAGLLYSSLSHLHWIASRQQSKYPV